MSGRQVLAALIVAVVLIAVVGITHKGAHVAAALASGVPLSDVRWGGFVGINPAINYDSFPNDWRGPAIYYAGGLAGAAVALVVYWFALARYRRTGTLFAWAVAGIALVVVGEQIGNAVAEGAFHDGYLRGSPFTAYVQAVPAWVAACIHAVWLAPIVPVARRLRRARATPGKT